MQIGNEVLSVLSNATTEGNSLKLNGTLDRKLYVSTNKVIELAGGKWSRKALAHLFEGDASEIMDQIILTGTIQDKKQELGYFPTPPPVVARLLELAQVESHHVVLEPSAGRGAIIKELLNITPHINGFEIDSDNFSSLYAIDGLGFTGLYNRDFLTAHPVPIHDRVVMNPPFAKNVAPKHVLHAVKFLKPGGLLVSVMPSSVVFRSDALNDSVRYHAVHIDALPENSFAESGTNVNTVIVTLEAPGGTNA